MMKEITEFVFGEEEMKHGFSLFFSKVDFYNRREAA